MRYALDCQPTSEDDEGDVAHLRGAEMQEGAEEKTQDTSDQNLDDIEREQDEPGSWLQGWTLEELKLAQDEDVNIAKFTAWKLA